MTSAREQPRTRVLSVRQGHHDLHVVAWEEPRLTVERTLVPVLVDLTGQRDHVALAESQLTVVFGLEVVQGLTAGLLGRWIRIKKDINKQSNHVLQ